MTTTSATTPRGPAPSQPRTVDWVSWARIVAVIAVVAIHVTSHLVLAWGDGDARMWHFGNLVQSASRWCVPVFVMVSGALLLGGRGGEATGDFLRRRAARIGVPLVIWTVFYLWLDAVHTGQQLDAYYVVQGFLWGKPYYHLYFLYVIAGLYLITPFLRVFVAAASRRLLIAATVVSLGLAAVDRFQHWWMGGGGFNAFTYFLPWIGYYLLGYLLATATIRRAHAIRAAACLGVAILLTHFGTWALFATLGIQHGRFLYEYVSPTTVLAAIAVGVLLRALADRPASSASRAASARIERPSRSKRLADLTFGVFLLHPIPLELLVRSDQPQFAATWADMGFHLGLIAVLVVGCGAASWLLRQVPFVRRLV